MEQVFNNPELSAAIRSGANANTLHLKPIDVFGEGKYLNISELRTAAITSTPDAVKQLMQNALEKAEGNPKTIAYSAERSWRTIQSFVREGEESSAMNILKSMPQEFMSGQQKRADETLAIAGRGNLRSVAMNMLNAGANPLYPDEQKRTAVMNFALMGDAPMVKNCLISAQYTDPEKGVEKALTMGDKDGWITSMFAISSDAPSIAKREVINVIRDAGWKFDKTCGKEGFAEIHLASAISDTTMITHLVKECDANPNQLSRDGFTPGMIAGQLGASKSITELGTLGANLELTQRGTGMSIAHYAAAKGHDDVLLALSAFKVDMQSPRTTGDQETPAKLAKQAGHKDTAKLINELDAPAPTFLLDNATERLRSLLGSLSNTARSGLTLRP